MLLVDRIKTNKTVLWSTLDYVSVPAGLFLATPFLIQFLGIEQFGVYILVNALLGFSSVFNFGFGDTALKYVSQYKNSGQLDHCASIIKTISTMTLLSGLLISALFFLATPITSHLFKIDHLAYAHQVLSVAAVLLPLRMLELVYVYALRGCYRYDLSGIASVTTKTLNLVVQVVLAQAGFGLPVLLISTVCMTALSVIWLVVSCHKLLGDITPGFSQRVFDEIVHFSRWSWIQGLAALLFVNVDRLMVSALLGPAALGVYGVCMQLAQNIHNVLSAAAHSVFPKISMLTHERTAEAQKKLAALYLSASRNVSTGAIFLATFMTVFSYDILRAWVGETIATQGYLVLSLLALAHGWYCCNHAITYFVLNGTGRPKVQALVSFVGAAVITVGCAILLPVFGLVGSALARFPDLPFRIGMRVYAGRPIAGENMFWVATDFIRLSVVGLSLFYLCRKAVQIMFQPPILFFHPGSLLVIALTGGLVLKLMVTMEGRRVVR